MTDVMQAAHLCQRNGDLPKLQALVPTKVNPNATVPSFRLNSVSRADVPLVCIGAASGALEVVKFLYKSGAKLEACDRTGVSFLLTVYSYSLGCLLWTRANSEFLH